MHRVNGQASDQVSVSDRGLLYGQSVFETIPICHQQPLLLEQHLRRLAAGCAVLAIPLDLELIHSEIIDFCSDLRANKVVLRVTVSMGEGERGYLNPRRPSPLRILSSHPFPSLSKSYWRDGIKVGLASVKLAAQPALAGIKHGNRLEQILARSEWQDDWQEALILDQENNIIEGTQSNLFLRHENVLSTPSLKNCGVAGIMRDEVLALSDSIGVVSKIMSLSLSDLESADEVFLTNSVIGIWPVKQCQNRLLNDFSLSHKLLRALEQNGAIPTL
jgi:4-amino-4-deoxychorismate lyase